MAKRLSQKGALAPADAARRLGIGRTKLYELMGSGTLRSFRIGKARRIPVEAVEALRQTGPAVTQTHPSPQTCRCALAFLRITQAFAACHDPTAVPLTPSSVVGEKSK